MIYPNRIEKLITEARKYPTAMATRTAGIPVTLAPPSELQDATESDLSGPEKREYKAHTEQMLVIPHVDADGICTGTYEVVRPGKTPYILNHRELDDGPTATMCPDAQYRNPTGGCKHQRRIDALLDEGLLPEEGEDAAEYLDKLATTYEQLVEERKALIDRQAGLRRQIAVKKENGMDAPGLEDTLSEVVERTGTVEKLMAALEDAPAVEMP